MITTVHTDRHGYVIEVFQNTRIPQLDAGKYPGTLMEVTGPIAPGMRWDGQTFVAPPPRIPLEAVVAEKERRAAMFPERFVKLITALGGDNAMKVTKYLGELHNTADRLMLSEPPPDYKDDKHWPAVPELHDLPIAQRVHESQSFPSVSSGQPISIHVAPVINASAPAPQESRPIVIQSESRGSEPAEAAHYGLDVNDPLYHHKLALVKSIEAMDEQGRLPAAIEPDVTAAAVLATAARSLEDFEIHKSRVHELLEAA